MINIKEFSVYENIREGNETPRSLLLVVMFTATLKLHLKRDLTEFRLFGRNASYFRVRTVT